MAYSICCEDDPVQGMVVPVELEDFVEGKFPDPAANALWTMDFNSAKFNFHKILYMMDSSVQGGGAQDRTPEAAVLYGVFEANERTKDVGDNACYAIGYRNGAYTAFLDPMQKVLLNQHGSPADNVRDVQVLEASSEVARMGHDEMRKYRKVAIHTNSPHELFPFDGDNLVDPNCQHLKRIARIKEQIGARSRQETFGCSSAGKRSNTRFSSMRVAIPPTWVHVHASCHDSRKPVIHPIIVTSTKNKSLRT